MQGKESKVFIVWTLDPDDDMTDIVEVTTNELRADELIDESQRVEELEGESFLRLFKTTVTLDSWTGLFFDPFRYVTKEEVTTDTEEA